MAPTWPCSDGSSGAARARAGGLNASRRPSPSSPSLPSQVQVSLGRRAFVDRLVWDLGSPLDASMPYACGVAHDLGLPWVSAVVIAKRVRERLDLLYKVGPCRDACVCGGDERWGETAWELLGGGVQRVLGRCKGPACS